MAVKKKAADWANVTIYVDPSPNDMFNVSALAYESDDSEDPDDGFDFDSQEFDDRSAALSFAGDEARDLVDAGVAQSATVLYDGSETFYYDGKKPKRARKRAKKNGAACAYCKREVRSAPVKLRSGVAHRNCHERANPPFAESADSREVAKQLEAHWARRAGRARKNPEFESVTFHVDKGPNRAVNVSALWYVDDDSEPADGMDDSMEFDTKKSALAYAKDLARRAVDDGLASSATVLNDGNEVFHKTAKVK